jgi:hypothetical protein
MTELTTTSIVSLFDTTKEERISFVRDLVERVSEGQTDPIKAHYSIKCMEEIIKNILADDLYKRCVLDEAEKNGKKFTYRNSEIQIKEAGVKYDYTQCGDPELLELYEAKAKIDTEIKAKEQFLRQLPTGGLQIVIDDEFLTAYPPAKSSTTTVQVTLK